MKVLNLVLLLTLSLTFFSCSDDEATPSNSDGVTGTWMLTDLDYAGTSTTAAGGVPITSDFSGTLGPNPDATVVFSSDGTYTSQGSYVIQLTTDFGGQSINTDVSINGFAGSGTWSESGTELTATSQGETTNMTIVEVSSNSLTLDWDRTETTTVQGSTNTQVIDGRYMFVRQ